VVTRYFDNGAKAQGDGFSKHQQARSGTLSTEIKYTTAVINTFQPTSTAHSNKYKQLHKMNI